MIQTLPDSLASQARNFPQRPALVQGTTCLSYGRLWHDARDLCALMRREGLGPGDRACLLFDHDPHYVCALYAVWLCGAVAVPLNPQATSLEISRVFRHSGSRLMVSSATMKSLQHIQARLPIRGISTRHDPLPSDTIEWVTWRPLHDEESARPATREGPPPDSSAMIVYTSGTTGNPKGILLSHRNLMVNTRAIVRSLGISRHDRVLTSLPFHYSYGNSVLHTHLLVGATVILGPPLIYAQQFIDALHEHRATTFPGVPSTFALLLAKSDWARRSVPSLRYVTQAGDTMPAGLRDKVRAALGTARFVPMYGQTEASARLTCLARPLGSESPASVGYPIPGVTLRICDEQGNLLPTGSIGEIQVRGDNVMLGYWQNEAATREVLTPDGWLRTGDLGFLDAAGSLCLEGRRRDIIKSGAHRINPAEIKEVLLELEWIEEAEVVGIADDLLSETIQAVLVCGSHAPDTGAVMRHCRQSLPPHKLPRTVVWKNSLPKTASGKVRKHLLRKEAS